MKHKTFPKGVKFSIPPIIYQGAGFSNYLMTIISTLE